jgi:hypothetical protein
MDWSFFVKFRLYQRRFVNTWFWRRYDQKEVDFIKDEGGKLSAFEFKPVNRGSPMSGIKSFRYTGMLPLKRLPEKITSIF